MRWVLLANPENRRARFFQEALARVSPTATLQTFSYEELLAPGGEERLEALLSSAEPTRLRIESPGENEAVMRALMIRGARSPLARFDAEQAARLVPEHGEILAPHQRFLGWEHFLITLSAMLERLAPLPLKVMSHPLEIRDMFDKRRAHARLLEASVDTTTRLPHVESYEALRAVMHEHDASRVFLKLCHGSSASGVVAYQASATREEAITSTHLVRRGDRINLYNSLKIRRYSNHDDVTTLIDALCAEQVVVERWVPKAQLDGKGFDLRVVAIGGRPHHTVGRASHSPMTNLHLGNTRCPLEELQARLDPVQLTEARRIAATALAAFPRAHYLGADVMMVSGSLRPLIIEVNAFGDLLPNLFYEGRDTYEAEIASWIQS